MKNCFPIDSQVQRRRQKRNQHGRERDRIDNRHDIGHGGKLPAETHANAGALLSLTITITTTTTTRGILLLQLFPVPRCASES